VRNCDDAIASMRHARSPESTQPGSFDPGCAGDYLLPANVTAEALASGALDAFG
jgi:hypothetical protein